MISKHNQNKIHKCIFNHPKIKEFINKVNNDEASEAGHSFAQEFQDLCLEILSGEFPNLVYVELGGGVKAKFSQLCEEDKEKILERSFGDMYFFENKLYNPIDCKLNASGCDGQPNTSAMGRQIKHLLDGTIDSFYILKLKVRTRELYFYDMYEHFYCLVYNMGTGQIMTKEKYFDPEMAAPCSTKDRVLMLRGLFEQKAVEHIQLKQKQLAERCEQMSRYAEAL